ncbi:MAG: radical SAM protein [Lachnospiraceae bacterium]
MFENCRICPRSCGVNRLAGEKGVCGCDAKLYAARAALHMWEEPCISGETGSGAIFFSGCNLGCVYCQNRDISNLDIAKEISAERLAEIFFELKGKGAANINLVTPTHYIPYITTAVELAKNQGFDLPIVYNTGGYEKAESLKILDGLVDIYLPDFKYFYKDSAVRYSKAADYSAIAKAALAEMYRQTGTIVFDENGMMKKGTIVRHLCLPGREDESKQIIKYLFETYGNNIYMSIMSQYTPLESFVKEGRYPELYQKISRLKYDEIIDCALEIGVENAFIQEEDVADESFIPLFDYEGL